jgi:hypothetical protein
VQDVVDTKNAAERDSGGATEQDDLRFRFSG